jgi:hypothetical protein
MKRAKGSSPANRKKALAIREECQEVVAASNKHIRKRRAMLKKNKLTRKDHDAFLAEAKQHMVALSTAMRRLASIDL